MLVSWSQKPLKEANQRAETWPNEANEELTDIAMEVDARLKSGTYNATSEEFIGIDRGPRSGTRETL
jgi:hypothetical protein